MIRKRQYLFCSQMCKKNVLDVDVVNVQMPEISFRQCMLSGQKRQVLSKHSQLWKSIVKLYSIQHIGKNKSQLELTKDTPYLARESKVWDVCCEYFEGITSIMIYPWYYFILHCHPACPVVQGWWHCWYHDWLMTKPCWTEGILSNLGLILLVNLSGEISRGPLWTEIQWVPQIDLRSNETDQSEIDKIGVTAILAPLRPFHMPLPSMMQYHLVPEIATKPWWLN